MNLETTVEYYYGETLRWSYGFDNPNKAAVIFACALPVLWWLWQISWNIKSMWLKVPALLAAASLTGGAWYCLTMTFSRGGLVAAVVAIAYLIGWSAWQGRKSGFLWHKSPAVWCSVLLLSCMAAVTVWSGLGARSAQALGNDASVGNRIELWGSALQMAAENPSGFGAGNSGEQYMQWYQPLDRNQGYRTMVNSYLTYLVEHGWVWASIAIALFVTFWVWTRPLGEETSTIALRALILAFLSAAAFSTTMEEPKLWVLPGLAAAWLAARCLWQRRSIDRTNLGMAFALGLVSCGSLYGIGLSKSAADPLKREFSSAAGGSRVAAIASRQTKGQSLGCVVDEQIVGEQYPRLLRELASATGLRLVLGHDAKTAQRILLMGQSAALWASFPKSTLVLLAPPELQFEDLRSLAKREKPIWVLLPEIDEDGRLGFWEETAETKYPGKFHISHLSGVGNRVDWAWDEVIAHLEGG